MMAFCSPAQDPEKLEILRITELSVNKGITRYSLIAFAVLRSVSPKYTV